ncbi:DUF2946 domain-containing protein [Caballeronia sordidicola]|uniref:DUF2946 domain-containing protein n=1 Tax=Caballeronia sordidicola TaxID=196367 RepID=UPI00094FECF2
MRRRLVRKFGSLVGMFVILMTALAPAVSQALASGARANAILSVHCSAVPHTQTRTHDQTPSQHSAAGHWDACGYCNFAAHSPAAPSSLNALPALVIAATSPGTAPAQPAAPYTPVFAALPRAPPFFA